MAGKFTIMGFPTMHSPSYKCRPDDGSCTADGGKSVRIDYLVDDGSPVKGIKYDKPFYSARTQNRKLFKVTEEDYCGGSGLYGEE